MKKLFLILTIFVLSVSVLKADGLRVENAIPTGLGSVVNPDFGGDVLVANTNPIGPMHSIKAPNGTIYTVVNDTLLTSNLGLIILQSTNDGNNWTLFGQGIGLRARFDQVKMIKTSDSVMCYFRVQGLLGRWNPLSGLVTVLPIPSTVVDFDATISSTNSVYVFFQTAGDTIRRWGSTDGGISFPNTGAVTFSGSRPRVSFSTMGDTLILNYRAPLRPGLHNKSVVRSGLIRQSSPGIIGSVTSSFADVITDTSVIVDDYKSVKQGRNVWLVWTEESPSGIDIKCRVSTSGGTIYDAPYTVAGSTTRNEYGFDIGVTQGALQGVDIIYHSDSLQAGTPTNASDKMYYRFSPLSAPNTVGPAIQFSTDPPVFSASGCRPVIVEMPANDFGALFIGYTSTGNKIFWNRFSQLTNISNNGNVIADKFELKQNYPNPFNPTTNITFNLPKNTFVNLKVYDMSGKEVAKLISQNMNQGNYTVTFDGKNLSSGVYFYKLESDNFSEVKKMSLIK